MQFTLYLWGIRMRSIIIIVLIVSLSLSTLSFAETYWIDDTNGGKTDLDDCKGGTPLSGTDACYFDDVDYDGSSIVAGDTVYFRDGTYTFYFDRGISPTNSGSSLSSPITFSAYNNESVEFVLYDSASITNWNMETDSDWTAYNSPTTSGRTSAQDYDGDYSWYFTVDGADQGIKSGAITVVDGEDYSIWIYGYGVSSSTVNIYITDSVGNPLADVDKSLSFIETWAYAVTDFTANGTTAYLQVRSPTGESSGTWYVDYVDIVPTSTTAVYLYGNDYIKVDGINFTNWDTMLIIDNDADYNEIVNCEFIGQKSNGYTKAYYGSRIQTDSDYNWIHDCEFGYHGRTNDVWHYGAVFEIGYDGGDDVDHNLIEGNEFYGGAHHVIGINDSYNIVRNNYLHNEVWYDVGGSDTSGRVTDLFNATGYRYNLLEANRIGYGGSDLRYNNPAGDGLALNGGWNIIRYNAFYQNDLNAIVSGNYVGHTNKYNRIFNNTFWYNGYDPDNQSYKDNWQALYTHAIVVADTSTISDWVFKNNIYYQNQNLENSNLPLISFATKDSPIDYHTVSNEWYGNVDGNPSFVSITGTPNPDYEVQFNFNLQSGSGCIDNGVALTAVAVGDDCNGGTGCDSTIEVDDALYFFDGWGVDDVWNTYGASVEEDYICVGTVSNCAQVDSVDYDTNIITMKNALDRDDSDDVWLYKKSDGIQVLFGDAQDQGAFESGGAPFVSTATINGSAAVITFSEDLDDTAFAKLINGDLLFTGTTTGASDLENCFENAGVVSCTADATFVYGETVALSSSGLTGDELCDGESNCIESINGEIVTNNTPEDTQNTSGLNDTQPVQTPNGGVTNNGNNDGGGCFISSVF